MRSASLAALLLLCTAPALAQQVDYDDRRAAVLRRCDDALLHGRTAEARACYQPLQRSPDLLVRAEATWALGDLRGANDLFRQAVAARPADVLPRLRWGRLFLVTHQFTDAGRLFQEALEIDPKDRQARIAMARLTSERFVGDVKEAVAELIEEEDASVEAQLVSARIAIEDGRYPDAQRAAQRALELANQQKRAPLEAWTLLAALEVIANRDPARWTKAALDYNPRYGSIFETLGYFEVIRRRYREADAWYARAVQVQPDLWSAQSERGLNLLRLGDREGARTHLERAYSGDAFSTATVNTLRLMDSYSQYDTIESAPPALQLLLHKSESGAMKPYVEQLVRESIATFSRRYGYTPGEKVAIELYPSHDDFAVRIAGLPGIGLLGVTFGHVVAMDSPSSRKGGDFHWGSTLWHEMAHVFTLSVTAHRVPRWLSEGLSVLEEWTTGPTPGVNVEPPVLDAFMEDKFLPIARLDEGFLHPSYENQVQVSYAQAGLACLYMEQRFGFAKVQQFLLAFREDPTTAETVRKVLGVTPEDFDAGFNAFMRQRFAPYIADSKSWLEQLRASHAAVEEKNWSAARTAAQEAIRILPEYTGSNSGYEALAAAEEGAGNAGPAITALMNWRKAGGWDPAGLRKLGALLLAANRDKEATEVLTAVNWADPLALGGHGELGELLLASRDGAAARREYEVLLALAPLDTATAHFGLARAYRELGDTAKSRRHLLQALETAPNYRPAQKMLLEMTGEARP